VGKQTFFKSPQIKNPQILGLISLSQIRKSDKLFMPANLRICDLLNLFVKVKVKVLRFGAAWLSFGAAWLSFGAAWLSW
jgi:hypothetical protein